MHRDPTRCQRAPAGVPPGPPNPQRGAPRQTRVLQGSHRCTCLELRRRRCEMPCQARSLPRAERRAPSPPKTPRPPACMLTATL